MTHEIGLYVFILCAICYVLTRIGQIIKEEKRKKRRRKD